MLVTRWWGGIRVTVFNCEAQYNEGRQQHPTIITESQTHDVSNHITKYKCIEATHCTPETYTMLQVIFIKLKKTKNQTRVLGKVMWWRVRLPVLWAGCPHQHLHCCGSSSGPCAPGSANTPGKHDPGHRWGCCLFKDPGEASIREERGVARDTNTQNLFRNQSRV